MIPSWLCSFTPMVASCRTCEQYKGVHVSVRLVYCLQYNGLALRPLTAQSCRPPKSSRGAQHAG